MKIKENPYGFCPICGAPGISRERRLDGNDRCANGHIYPSAQAKKYSNSEEPEIEFTPRKSKKDKIMNADSILDQISLERERQNFKWGGPLNDDKKTPFDWHATISDYNGWARKCACVGSYEEAKNRYIQIAALAVAAVESLDRHVKRDELMMKGKR